MSTISETLGVGIDVLLFYDPPLAELPPYEDTLSLSKSSFPIPSSHASLYASIKGPLSALGPTVFGFTEDPLGEGRARARAGTSAAFHHYPNDKIGVTLLSMNMCDAFRWGAGMFQTERVLTPGLTV